MKARHRRKPARPRQRLALLRQPPRNNPRRSTKRLLKQHRGADTDGIRPSSFARNQLCPARVFAGVARARDSLARRRLRSCPQPASMSAPRDRRRVLDTPPSVSSFWKAATRRATEGRYSLLWVGLPAIRFTWHSTPSRSSASFRAWSSESLMPLNRAYSKVGRRPVASR